jgi:deoxyribodipyrimidine photo-lyase
VNNTFPTDFASILSRIDGINPEAYARTRNFKDGAVSQLSPYLSRGVIGTRQILQSLADKGYGWSEVQKFVQELTWREFYQRLWQSWEDDLFEDILQTRSGVNNRLMPTSILQGNTGIQAIDEGIKQLEQSGYMHNHLRMYVASMACNLGKSHWPMPAAWLYYHLLDGDLASNTCSWQWVAGTFNGRKYYCNQQNIDRYFDTRQEGSFLDQPYESLPKLTTPEPLRELSAFQGKTRLPATEFPTLDPSKPLYIYNGYNLDPNWDKEVDANRLLLLEPSHFQRFPVSDRVINFIQELAKNIENIQIFTGEVSAIPEWSKFPKIVSKEHPAFQHYPGIKQPRDWMFPQLHANHTSFFRFWKQAERKATALFSKKETTAPAALELSLRK